MERQLRPLIAISFAVILTISFAGCVGAAAQLMYMWQGLEVKAVYDGLQDSKVAIVCVSDASSYGPDTLTNVVGRALGMRISKEVKKASVISQHEIENWKDTHGWNEVNFQEIGKGVGADKVVAIEIGSYSIHEGSTMYKGRSMITTTVYDLKNGGEVVFSQGPAEYQFPKSHGRPAISTSEQRFEAIYLAKLVDNIARNFYDHERVEAVAEDASGFDSF